MKKLIFFPLTHTLILLVNQIYNDFYHYILFFCSAFSNHQC